MGALFDYRDCPECGGVGIIAWQADPSSRYPACRVPHADPCGICTEWATEEERLALLLERAGGVTDPRDRAVLEHSIRRLLAGEDS